jgi:hypothetical protein
METHFTKIENSNLIKEFDKYYKQIRGKWTWNSSFILPESFNEGDELFSLLVPTSFCISDTAIPLLGAVIYIRDSKPYIFFMTYEGGEEEIPLEYCPAFLLTWDLGPYPYYLPLPFYEFMRQNAVCLDELTLEYGDKEMSAIAPA